ncbi:MULTISPECIES: pyridoxamine 5'-phosphate oxidase family protein [Mycolicibacterium]|uniref:pyridoxamine 5'-phosphate oxidase family protein n=1 Tax=Mycolicibacterium monacense TaxID=85693 RepID=UPI0007EAC2F9|nr:pyridoxamine 5'-phosphate oxidase family protein [Mycolicibacterium monacense]OBB56209.1 hypothetical protein A6B34_06940 [Mycolicibacterium monacense]OBF56449.1 hypothetical protein A5778_06155 [Mycolicibacterium monacense]
MSFTDEELAYMASQPLARIATVDDEGQPDVVPVGFEFDGTYINNLRVRPTVSWSWNLSGEPLNHHKMVPPKKTVH